MVSAVVGAGGKTTLIHTLARQYRQAGKRVFVTTTTHMYIEPDTLLTADAGEILRALEDTGYAMAGVAEGIKIRALPQTVYHRVCRAAEEVLVEADGSRQLPLKVPGPNEPVIPENAERILVVCGLRALGQPLGQAVHRPELAAALLGIGEDACITGAHIRTLVREGYVLPLRRRYPGMAVSVHPVSDGSEVQEALARELRKL